MPTSAPHTLLYETLHGSHAYNLATPTSDVDLKGLFVGPAATYLGFRPSPEQIDLGPDHVLFEIRKFFRLAANANPTLLEILWTHPDHHRVVTPAASRLLAQRDLFLSRRVHQSFAGYALAQLKRIKTHRRWLLHPPAAEPTREASGLPDRPLLSADQQGAAEALQDREDAPPELSVDFSPNFLEALAREKRYRSARREWDQYRTWLRERNPARAELEARFGYDTKHALHLIRLLRMAVEIAETGQVIVQRPDRDDLLGIRAGRLAYDALLEHAEDLEKRGREATLRSNLPEAPDSERLDALCVSIVQEILFP